MSEEVITVSFCQDGVLDHLETLDAVALGFFLDERPLKGISGFADWRLHGLLSRLVMQGRLSGTLLESCLIPSRGRLPMEKVFLFGLGPVSEMQVTTFRRVVSEVVISMGRARVNHYAVSLWDLSRGRVAPEEAAGIFFRNMLSESDSRPRFDEGRRVTFVETGPWGQALRDSFLKLRERSRDLPVRLEVK